jgi:transposase-like protein
MGRRKRRKFTAEYKAEVVKLINTSGKGVGEVARELDLTDTAVRAWVARAEIDAKRDPHGPLTTEERAEVTRLRRELRTVTMERDFLVKAAAFFARSGK